MTIRIDLEDVDRVYEHAASEGCPPLWAVENYFGVSHSTAARRVREAREAGILPEEVLLLNAKAVRVARRLGIDYDVLVSAVREEAGGDLRVVGGVS